MKLFFFTWVFFCLDPSTAVHCLAVLYLYAFLEAIVNDDVD